MPKPSSQLSRRMLFAGAGTATAVVAATRVLPDLKGDVAPTAVLDLPKPTRGGGYSLSAHVQRYYKTTRL